MGLVLFKNSPTEVKIKAFFSIIDKKLVSYEEIYNILKINIVIDSELLTLKKILSRIFREF